MILGAPYALGEFLSLRELGWTVAPTNPPSFLISWSDDGETLSYGEDFSLTMTNFRRLAKHFLLKAEELCRELMFGLSPDIDLSRVKDSMTNAQYGFSFVQHTDNRLVDAYLDLSTKACTSQHNGLFSQGRWDWEAVLLYRKKVEAFEEMLVEITGGIVVIVCAA